MLNAALFSVSELDFSFLDTNTGTPATLRARLLRADAGSLTANRTGLRRFFNTGAGIAAAFGTGFRLQRFTVPFGIAEMLIGFNEIVNRKIILAVIEPCAASDDLFEFNNRIDRPHEHNIADVAGINAGGKFLRRGQDCRQRFFVVLKVPQMLLAQGSVIGRHPLAVIRLFAGFHLIDQIAHGQRVILACAKDQRLFPLIDQIHEQFYTVGFTFLYLDNLIEIRLQINLPELNFSLHDHIIGRVNIIINRCGDLPHLKRSKKPVVDAVFQ